MIAIDDDTGTPPDWIEFKDKIKTLYAQAGIAIKTALPEIEDDLAHAIFYFSTRRKNLVSLIKERYDKPFQYTAYAILNGGTGISYKESPYKDFPDDFSIEKFLKGIIDNPRILLENPSDSLKRITTLRNIRL